MPKKKTDSIEEPSEELEHKNIDEIKPKRRIVRKVKSPRPPADDEVSFQPIEEVEQVRPLSTSSRRSMDMAPMKETVTKHVQESEDDDETDDETDDQADETAENVIIRNDRKSDASFLAPQQFSFNLRKETSTRKWIRGILYFISFLIILAAIALVGLTYYPGVFGKIVKNIPYINRSSPVSTQTAGSNSATTGTSGSGTSFAIGLANVPTPITTAISSAFSADTNVKYSIDSSPVSGLPAVTGDTLFYKTSAQAQTTDALAALATLGITPQIQQSGLITDDMVLDLTSNATAVNLSAYTATSNNASGVTGLAKKYCTTLQTYHISSCTAVNAPSPATGLGS